MMKKKIDWKILIITSLICLIPIIFGVILYDQLPEQMAVHFGLNNEPNSFAPKEFALFGIPLLMFILQVFCCISSDFMEEKKQNKKYITIYKWIYITIYKWIIPIIEMVVYLTMLAYGAGIELDMRMIVCITLGIVFTLVGNYMPKTELNKLQMNYIRADFWKKIKRPAGYFFVIIGLAFIISAFLNSMVSLILLGIIIVTAILISIYSIYLFYKKSGFA